MLLVIAILATCTLTSAQPTDGNIVEPPLSNETFSIEDRDVYVTMPYDLHMFIPNIIDIQTNWDQLRVTYSTAPAKINDVIKDDGLYKVTPTANGWYGLQIPYYVPFYEPSPNDQQWHKINIKLMMCGEDVCPQSKVEQFSIPFRVNPKFLQIIGEVERTKYKAGEHVRARFHVLNSEQTAISNGTLKLPKYLLDSVNVTYTTAKHLVQLEGVPSPTDHNFTCKSLAIRGPGGIDFERRSDVPARKSIYVDFVIPETEQPGIWLLALECMQHKKVISFQVVEETKDDFHAYMIPLGSVFKDSGYANFRVCARHNDGRLVEAGVLGLVCVCGGERRMRFPLSPEDTDRLFETPRCFEEQMESRRCEQLEVTMNGECVDIHISTYPFRLGLLNIFEVSERVLYCFRIFERRTGTVVSKCEHSQLLNDRGAGLSIGDTVYYHPGLPFQVVTRYWHPGVVDSADQTIRLDISQYILDCSPNMQRPSIEEMTSYFYNEYRKTDLTGSILFTIPPIRSAGFMIAIAAAPDVDKTKLIHNQIGHQDNLLSVEKILKPWPSVSGAHLQVWLDEYGGVQGSCAVGSFSVRLISNLPLADKVIWIEMLISGIHNVTYVPASDDPDIDSCQPMDNEFGHYICEPDGISCLPGWKGEDCLMPSCAIHCHPAGGWCQFPGQCQCRRGWTGKSCDICIPCGTGACVALGYHTCICELPVYNYTCNALEMAHEAPVADPAVRTIYQRVINVDIDFRFGRETKVLFYFYRPIRNGRQERVTAEAFVETTDCYPPAYSAQTSFAMLTKSVYPGSSIRMRFKVPTHFREDNETHVCHVRTTLPDSDPANELHQFDWNRYTNELHSFWRNRWEINHSPSDAFEAFQSAGLTMFNVGEQAELSTGTACPNMLVVPTAEISDYKLYQGFLGTDPRQSESRNTFNLNNFYEPTWLFEPITRRYSSDGNLTMQLSATFSEKYKSMGIHIMCTTKDSGVWIGKSPELSPSWISRSSLIRPSEMVIGISTHLNLSVLFNPTLGCGQAILQLQISSADFFPTTAKASTFCICTNVSRIWSFGIIPIQTGYLNFSLLTTYIPNAPFCNWSAKHTDLVNENNTALSHLEKFDNVEMLDVFVKINGVENTVHYTNLICHPHDPYVTLVRTVLDNVDYGSAHVIDQVHVNTMCSFDYFHGELEKSHSLAPWNIQMSEEVISRMQAAVGYLLYLRSPKSLGNLPKSEHIAPLQRELGMLFDRLRDFVHPDGSISNFGISDVTGSVWLSAEALRAIEMAGQTGFHDGQAQQTIKAILDFVRRRLDYDTGCLNEVGTKTPLALHGSAGRMSTELHDIMLTSYVAVALHEQPHVFSNMLIPYASDIDWITGRMKRCLIWGSTSYNSQGYERLSNYHIALAAYASALLKTDDFKPGKLIYAMLRRNVTVWSQEQKISMFYLDDDTNIRGDGHAVNAVAMEATAYMYLALVETKLFPALLLPIVKYIVFNHDWEIHSQFTHSHGLIKQVLSDYFSYRIPKSNFGTESILCTTVLQPAGYVHFEEILEDKLYSAEYVALPAQERSVLREIKQAINGLDEGQCGLIDTSLTYRDDYQGLSSRPTDIFSVTKRSIDSTDPRKPRIEICFHFISHMTPERTGYINMEILPPSYTEITHMYTLNKWNNNQSEAALLRPRYGRIDSTGLLHLTFDGITKIEIITATNPTDIRRCVEIVFRTTYFADNPNPVWVRVYDFHGLYPVTQYTFKLPATRAEWGLDERSYIPGPHKAAVSTPCPKCVTDEDMSEAFIRDLRRSACRKRGDIIVFKAVNTSFTFGDAVTVYTTRMTDLMNYWQTTLKLPSRDCSCSLPENTKHMMVSSDVSFDYSVVDASFSFGVSVPTKSLHLIAFTGQKENLQKMKDTLNKHNVGPACPKLQMALNMIFSNVILNH